MKTIVYSLIPVLFACCSVFAQKTDFGESNNNARDVSLTSLIADPQSYNDTIIRVQGVLNLEFEGDALYLTKDHWKFGIVKEAVWLSIQDNTTGHDFKEFSNHNGQYVLIEGVFDSRSRGHFGMFSGSIKKINRISLSEEMMMKGLKK